MAYEHLDLDWGGRGVSTEKKKLIIHEMRGIKEQIDELQKTLLMNQQELKELEQNYEMD